MRIAAVFELYFGSSRCAQPLDTPPRSWSNPPDMSLIPFAPLFHQAVDPVGNRVRIKKEEWRKSEAGSPAFAEDYSMAGGVGSRKSEV